MRVAIVYFSNKKRKKLSGLAGALADGIRSQGHQVDVIDGNLDINSKLTVYRFNGHISYLFLNQLINTKY